MGQTVFTASNATWATPTDWNNSANWIEGIAGGGGGNDNNSGNGEGGGGGAYGKAINQTLTANPATNAIVVGAAGTGGTGSNNSGSGGATSFKNSGATTLMSANGGTRNTGGTTGTGSTVYAGGAAPGNGGSGTYTGMAGGGAGGPNGVGGAGGAGIASGLSGSGAGGGGAGGRAGTGGYPGGVGTASTPTAGPDAAGGAGGNNNANAGGGAGDTNGSVKGGNGTAGGGGGGGGLSYLVSTNCTDGGTGSIEDGTTYTPSWTSSTNGAGGGAGGPAGASSGITEATGSTGAGTTAAGFGGGGSGGNGGKNGGAGHIGLVVVTWTPGGAGTNVLGSPPAFASAAIIFTAPALAVLSIYLGDQVLSAGITTLNSQATHVYVCSSQPATYAGVASVALGSANPGLGNVAAAPSGRGVAVNAANVTMTGAGTAACWAITDNTNSRLLATGPLSAPQVVASSDVWQVPGFTITLPN